MAVTQEDAQEFLAGLINSGEVTSQEDAQARLAEFINTGGVQETVEITQPEPKEDLGLQLPSAEPLTPIQEEEKRFEEVIEPQQMEAKAGALRKAGERQLRRAKGESTVGEQIEDVLFTRDVTESGEKPSLLASASGVASLPARVLGDAFGLGELEEESTKILKPAIESLNEWGDDPENENLVVNTAQLLGNIVLETASDPLAIAGTLKGAINQSLKALGKAATTKQVDDLVEKAVKESAEKVEKKAFKLTQAKDVGAEKILVDAGGAENVVKRLDEKGIKLKTTGQRKVPQEKTREIIDKLKNTRIEEFDITDAIEATVVPIKKKGFLAEALRGNVTKETNLNKLVKSISEAGDNSKEISKLLRDAGWDNPSKAAGIFARTGDNITGSEARDFIAELNKATKGKNVTASQQGMNKIRMAIEGRLKKAVGDKVPDDALEEYISLREAGTEKFTTKTGKLSNIIKRNPDKTINEQESVQALEKMIDDAMGEIWDGKKGLAVKNLQEIDELAGTDIAEIAELLGLEERFALGGKGQIGAIPATVKAPPKRSIVEGSVVGGQAGGTAIALRNITSDIVNKSNKKKIANLINFIAKEKGKLKISKQKLDAAKKDIEAGKKFLLSEIDKGNAVKVFDAMTSRGFITVKQLVQQIGKEEAMNVAEQAEKSQEQSVRNMAKKLRAASK